MPPASLELSIKLGIKTSSVPAAGGQADYESSDSGHCFTTSWKCPPTMKLPNSFPVKGGSGMVANTWMESHSGGSRAAQIKNRQAEEKYGRTPNILFSAAVCL